MPAEPTLADFDALTHWQRHGDALAGGSLSRTLVFRSFRAAFAFMTDVADLAESQDHHPDWSNRYNRVTVSLTSHDVKGLTQRDIALARGIDALAETHGARAP
ncbi:MAG: 4a-hydroxytetrahydrobiopterin dehydratase [Pseudomonadota bacterium]